MARRRTASFLVAIVLLLVATVTLAGGLPLRLVKGDATAVVELDREVLTEGTAYYKNSKGVVSGPFKIKGVRLIDLVDSIGGMEATDKLLVVSSDGYVTELDYAQACGDMAATRPDGSPVEGRPVLVPVLITWSDPGMEKDLPRLGFLSSVEGGLMTESKYWARNVVEIRIVPAGK